jgi:hypothetical protein
MNLRGARCLLNIKNKQILSRKTTTTTNLAVSVSPSSLSSSLSNNSSQLSASPAPLNNSQSYRLTFADLNERLFACLLSNFSCKLVENFLTSKAGNNKHLLQTGFIRKQKLDNAFSFVSIANERNEATTVNNSGNFFRVSKYNYTPY